LDNEYRDSGGYGFSFPYLTFSGSGGSDVLTLTSTGVFLLLFDLVFYTPATPNEVAIVSSSTLFGVTVLNETTNLSTPAIDSCTQFAVVTAEDGGEIYFPSSTELSALYGAAWLSGYCYQVVIVRLS